MGVNLEKTKKELIVAFENGVNYFDTAYIYPGSEEALGEFLASGYREKVYVATKLPYTFCKKREDFDSLFDEQKKRLKTDYIDYYLIHMLSDVDAWKKLCDMGIIGWIEEKKKAGEIRNIGFSYHGGVSGFKNLIDIYTWDFCQIQLNYLDETTQAGVAGLKYASEKGLPVIIMEPLQGGKLANPTRKVASIIAQSGIAHTPVELALRWLWNFPEVTCVLSGMNDTEQILQNTKTADTALPNTLSEEETALFSVIKEAILEDQRVPCTACNYCMPCPHGVDIPSCFAAYNTRMSIGYTRGLFAYLSCTSLKEKSAAASACVKCGLCEKKCPQGLLIRDYLDEIKAVMEGPIYRIALHILKKHPKVMKWGTTKI